MHVYIESQIYDWLGYRNFNIYYYEFLYIYFFIFAFT